MSGIFVLSLICRHLTLTLSMAKSNGTLVCEKYERSKKTVKHVFHDFERERKWHYKIFIWRAFLKSFEGQFFLHGNLYFLLRDLILRKKTSDFCRKQVFIWALFLEIIKKITRIYFRVDEYYVVKWMIKWSQGVTISVLRCFLCNNKIFFIYF